MTNTPYVKLIKGLQEEYSENNSVNLSLSKTEFLDLCYSSIGSTLSHIRHARKMLVERELLTWPLKSERVVLSLERIKKEKI